MTFIMSPFLVTPTIGPTAFNPADAGTNITIAPGGLVISNGPGVGTQAAARTFYSTPSGKWYYEFLVSVDSNSWNAGLMTGAGNLTANLQAQSSGVAYSLDSFGVVRNGSTTLFTGLTYTNGDYAMLAFDLDSGLLWTGKNGTWNNSGDPAAGTGAVATGISGTYFGAVSADSNSSLSLTFNFGASAFQYSVPSGFLPGFGV